MSVTTANLGFPRIGPRRELKKALEAFWAGQIEEDALRETARSLRAANWERQSAAGIAVIPSNDFSLYDQVLDTSVMLGAIPEVYRALGAPNSLDVYFAMARGTRSENGSADTDGCCHANDGADAPAQEMTKWFDTNYHYMVPEVGPGQTFSLCADKPLGEFEEALALGHRTRPVVLGPITWLLLAKSHTPGFAPLSLLPAILPVYRELLGKLRAAGAGWVQIDEPALVLDLDDTTREAFRVVYGDLAGAAGPQIMLATYFGGLEDNFDLALSLPVAGLHLDLVRAPDQLERALVQARDDLVLSLGIVDGRNVWKADLGTLLDRLAPAVKARREIQIAPSCSLLHSPIDLALETDLDPQLVDWLAFGVQKLEELALLGLGLERGRYVIADELSANADAITSRRGSPLTNDRAVRARAAGITAESARRDGHFAQRSERQRERLGLPPFPTTTIGSFPQTDAVRKARADHRKGTLDDAGYDAFLREETERAIRWQEEIGLDVLVHGEFERNDMVQYFGERLSGFAFTRAAWVQSYGSRCVRPPILYGDVSRPRPMTVDWWRHAQGLTERPVKGMLTGPVTILQWSFVRDDQPRADTCRQIALAIRDEVNDLEAAGARIIQIDEAALREGLPLRRAGWGEYLDWAVESFRLTASGVAPETQIHTHMCYSEFNDIIAAIGAMDADVISIETARSKMELLDAFATYRYPAEIGPGVYDIHSPRIPPEEEMADLLRKASAAIDPGQLWVNPDCGLKTRKWDDVRPALVNMVAAARAIRAEPF
ncbi:5-methyltetrahydropteroyltriglutamate--homocysteine S-methyltransferase [Pelagerythrobacter marensis]|uniref:5-methyltetrahydropteroyltriglutamate--homocysteine methyltransferase n=1 Tax=Pelagerythrobacter marensis TaxID=543877 RepID=A0A0G3X981_9SPHN|nr:5-methyltetrahydropteroyltriglutamate--homocysteine S-methyltransferase [Pelagerythrobacter marensis]AKM07164.1 5-methyltetrahydropteroyltriglutamate--homocysteine methyltransferase [Pelagerythrobacter marensis]